MKNRIKEARKMWPRAAWILGVGEYASVSTCPPGTTVMLFQSRMEAEIAKCTIDDTGCGGRCRRHHKIVYLGVGEEVPAIPREEVIAFMRSRRAAG